MARSGSASFENRRQWLQRELDELAIPIPGTGYYAALTDNMVRAIMNSNAVYQELLRQQGGSMATGFPGLEPIVHNAEQQLQSLVNGITAVR